MDVKAISVAGQQHGCVLLDHACVPVRPAQLWNNVASAPEAEWLNGMADFASGVGQRLVASFTITKLAHIFCTAPDDLARAASVRRPHDWLNYRLTGELSTDRGDASDTGWWSPHEGTYRRDLLALPVGEDAASRLRLPMVLGPEERAGVLSAAAARDLGLPLGIPVGPGTGDNLAAALGVGAKDSELIISLRTSGTTFSISDEPTSDPTGDVAAFADGTGRYLPLACMLNCTRVVDTIALFLGIERHEALVRAGRLAPGAEGMVMLPYFGGELMPNFPYATGSVAGLTNETATLDLLLRAAVDGVVAALAYCVDALEGLGVTVPGVTLVGGGAIHPVWQQAVADATGLPVSVREGSEAAARGAAIQAASIALGERITDIADQMRPQIVSAVSPRTGVREALQLNLRR